MNKRIYHVCAALLLGLLLSSCMTKPAFYAKDKFVGNLWPDAMEEDIHGSVLWSQVTPANAGKWESVEGIRDEMRWGGLDSAYERAKGHGLPFRLHTLVWGNQQPRWLESTPVQEQREEIEEWMALLSARYPDVDFIDVVNEPLHVLPVYHEALGGKGDSGYEWVVESFRLARKYFPRAKLHLNDYNILKTLSKAREYVQIVKLLQAENLIDGVGMQAHFLEETRGLTAKVCLDTVAATGLPLFITEFDVDIKDDILQAHKFAELFAIFYEYPQIEGITLWGAVEGRMWRRNGYLIRRDGTYRPSMEWLINYLTCDKSYVIPEYKVPPREGKDGVNRIEAESFDEGRGVQAEGSVLSYIDGSDWARFSNVVFEQSCRKFRIRYSKGRGSASRVRVVKGDVDSAAVVSLTLENTESWDDFRILEIEWPAFDGIDDVYLHFDGAKSVANIDYIEFTE
ncbi:MAG: endo-1,4-beta-xylanase [Spirochaetales bacterium]|nr:endo-1,4-beta-xylanase [Spirochaetales bacterium]